MMELPVSGGKFLFTVEQLELVRRLRNSGLTKQQVLSAFDSFERLDHQLGDVYNIPLSLALQAQLLHRLAVGNISDGTASLAHISELSQQAVVGHNGLSHSPQLVLPCVNVSSVSRQQQAMPSSDENSSVQQHAANGDHCLNSSASWCDKTGRHSSQSSQILTECSKSSDAGLILAASVNTLQAVSNASESRSQSQSGYVSQLPQLRQFVCTDQHNSSQSHTQSLSTNHSYVIEQLHQQLLQSSAKEVVNGCSLNVTSDNAQVNVSCNGEEGEVDSNELMQFLSMGEAACCEEIKAFIAKYGIKQQQIASLAGVSQPYVSRYLKGDFTFMSERSCRSIKKWYLAYRRNPEAIGPAASAANHGTMTVRKLAEVHGSYCDGSLSTPNVPSHSDIIDMLSHVARRDRFVFRQNQLEILERSFTEDSYPVYEKREQIANLCNTSTETALGRPLLDKECVTVQIVSNWFANKRKDLRKGVKEENGDNIQVQPMVTGAKYDNTQISVTPDARQLNTVEEHNVVNIESMENEVFHVSMNGSHILSASGQSVNCLMN